MQSNSVPSVEPTETQNQPIVLENSFLSRENIVATRIFH